MTPAKSLKRRLNRLEVHTSNDPDFIELTLAALSYEDLLLLQESAILHQAGLDEKEIAEIFGGRYQEVQQATERFHEEYNRIVMRAMKNRMDVG